MTTHHAGSFAHPLPTRPQMLAYAAPQSAATRLGDRYFLILSLALLGYALGGRGFAYWGINPLFIGEIMLLCGVFILLKTNAIIKVLTVRPFLPLILFMCWGAICTLPHLDTYKKDAIRDAVVWGYGTYAFIIAGLFIANPVLVQKMVLYYRKFVFWFLVLGPITCLISTFFEEMLPAFPGGDVPIIQVKGGDTCVHLAGTFAYIVALGAGMKPWIGPLLVPLMVGLNLQGRAGLVAFCSAIGVTMTLRPFQARAMRIFFVMAVGLFFLWASEVRIERGPRELSFRMLIKSFTSTVGDTDDEAMQGSKDWRMRWWRDIIEYTFRGPYFWMGKGFGINLANDDGYQVDANEALRSPHNGHLTMLARSGVPGFTLWVISQVTWSWLIVKTYIRARRQKHLNWAGVFLFLGAYWAAFLANATFDVFLEGPMGGIWFYCIYGAGIACVHLYKRHPGLLTPVKPMAIPVYGRV